MNPSDDHDDLWQLLGKARTPAVSPYFARKVVRAVRQPSERGSWLAWLLRYWQIPAMAACVAAIVGGSLQQGNRSTAGMAEPTLAALPDVGVIGHLDELLDSEKNSVWLAGDAE